MEPHPEVLEHWRAPSSYSRCRRPHCTRPPVADLNRNWWRRSEVPKPQWWAYCADHLAEYNREVRGVRVWWKGSP